MADFDQIKSAVENSHLRICTKQEAQRVGIYPNRKATFDYLPGVGAIIVRRGDRDFALGKRALAYLRAAITEKRITEGWIVLLNNDAFVNAAPLDQVERIVSDMRPWEGGYGEYFWLPDCIDPQKSDF